jgi:hypothetical protein
MTNPNLSQRERSQYNPLNLGKFDRTSLRFLTSTLGMRSQIIQGGIGNNTYNNWFQVTLEKAGWIILIKGGTVLSTSNTTKQNLYQDINSRVMLAVYDQNYNPIQGRIIQQEPDAYRGNVAGAQSDLYNNFDSNRFDKGDEMFYELEPGNYLICVSATRNEEFNYGVGLVIDINDDREQFILTEDTILSYVLQESDLNVPGEEDFFNIPSDVTSDVTLATVSAYSVTYAAIASGVFVQVNNNNPVTSGELTWIIGPDLAASGTLSENKIILDATENWTDTLHELSLTEWKEAWARDHSMDEKFPSGVFTPYANTP